MATTSPIELIDAVLGDYDSIVGVNCTNNDLTYLVDVLGAVCGRADVHVGGPMHALSCLALGGDGYLSSEGNLAPRLCVSLTEAYGRGDVPAACAAYAQVMRLHAELRRLGGINATKAALELLGLPGGAVRRPRLPVTDDQRKELAEMLETLDIRTVEGLA